MLLQIFTEKVPFHYIADERDVEMQVVFKNIHPRRPKSALRFGLTDDVWTLMEKCWDRLPSDRPSMKTVASQLIQIKRRQQQDTMDEERASLHSAESDVG